MNRSMLSAMIFEWGESMCAYSQHFHDLVRDFKQRPFVLFLGAGVNGILCPQWPGVLNYLQEAAHALSEAHSIDNKIFKTYCEKLGYESRAELFKLLLGPSYPIHVKKSIYEDRTAFSAGPSVGFSYRELKKYMRDSGFRKGAGRNSKYEMLYNAARLARHDLAIAVITLNYDNFVEMAINALSDKTGEERRVYSIPGGHLLQKNKGKPLHIYHVHGFLPYPTPDLPRDSKNIVLSQDEYIDAMSDVSSVSYCSPIHFLTNYPTLFIGLSMSDWNLLRFLRASLANKRRFSHYCILDSDSRESAQLHSRLMRAYGVKTIYAIRKDPDIRYQELREIISKLCQFVYEA